MKLPAVATIDENAALAESLPDAVKAAGAGPLRIDAGALTMMDTSTIALVLQAKRLAQAAGIGFELVGIPAKLGELARLYGVDDLLSTPSPTPAVVA